MSSLRPSALDSIRDDSLAGLEEALASIHAQDAAARSGQAHSVAALCHRRLAICALLADADPDSFFRHLCHSANARLALLQAKPAALDPLFRCASKELAFVDALAAGRMDSAIALANLAASKPDPAVEYEDDFLLQHFLHQLALRDHAGKTADLAAILARWEVVLEGEADPYLDVCRALLAGDSGAFDGALGAVIAARTKSFADLPRDGGPNDELRRTEGVLFMTGLALLRLAEGLGIETKAEYPTIPSLARLAPGRSPPSPTAWMSAL